VCICGAGGSSMGIPDRGKETADARNSADSDNVGVNDIFPRTSIVMGHIGLGQQIVVDVNFVETICHQISCPACKHGSDCMLFLILLLRILNIHGNVK